MTLDGYFLLHLFTSIYVRVDKIDAAMKGMPERIKKYKQVSLNTITVFKIKLTFLILGCRGSAA